MPRGVDEAEEAGDRPEIRAWADAGQVELMEG